MTVGITNKYHELNWKLKLEKKENRLCYFVYCHGQKTCWGLRAVW